MSTPINLIGSVCSNNVNFTAFIADFAPNDFSPLQTLGLSQTQAVNDCAGFAEVPFTLGPIQNLTEFDAVRSLLRESDVVFPLDRLTTDHSIGFFIGLEAQDGQELGGGNTSRFTFLDESVDPELLTFYHGPAGDFPWATGEPSNFNGGQFCGQVLFSNRIQLDRLLDGLVEDGNCASTSGYICRGPCFDLDDDALDDEVEQDVSFSFLILGGLVSFAFALLIFLFLLFERSKKLRKVKQNREKFLLDSNIFI